MSLRMQLDTGNCHCACKVGSRMDSRGVCLGVQVYTGYFWFCTVYFVLAIIMTHIMMRYPPLGQRRSTWMAWLKVNTGLGFRM